MFVNKLQMHHIYTNILTKIIVFKVKDDISVGQTGGVPCSDPAVISWRNTPWQHSHPRRFKQGQKKGKSQCKKVDGKTLHITSVH